MSQLIEDAEQRLLTCALAGCGKQFAQDDAHRMELIVACTGRSDIAAFKHEGHLGGDHFACCPAHAYTVALACYAEHLEPEYRQALAARGMAYDSE